MFKTNIEKRMTSGGPETPRLNFKDVIVADAEKIKFSDYHKPAKIKKINLGEFFDLGRTLSSLSKSERETLNWLLNKSLYPKD